MKPQAALAEYDRLPLILTLAEVATLYRISQATVRRGLQLGTFRPQPWARYPYRWKRLDVIADLRQQRDQGPVRQHGFAAKRRPLKATLDGSKKKLG